MKKKIVAIIPAKNNSLRVTRKNTRKFDKISLVEIAIKTAIKSKLINEVVVTSESKEILNFRRKYPIKFIERPKKLSSNTIMPDASIIHCYKKLKKTYDYIVMLQPTSPLRTTNDIDHAIKQIILEKSDSLLSVFESHSFLWKKIKKNSIPINYHYLKRPRSQNMTQFQENGAIYITKPKIYFSNKNRLGGKISLFLMKFWNSFDINSLEDFQHVEKIYKNNSQ